MSDLEKSLYDIVYTATRNALRDHDLADATSSPANPVKTRKASDSDIVKAIRMLYPDWKTNPPTYSQVKATVQAGASRTQRLRELLQTLPE